MALRKLVRRNYGGKLPVSIKYQNLHTFKEGLILLCQSILETRIITHLHDSAHFTIPLNVCHKMKFLKNLIRKFSETFVIVVFLSLRICHSLKIQRVTWL